MDRASQAVGLEGVLDAAAPGVVEVGHEGDDPVDDGCREGDADGHVLGDVEALDDAAADLGDGLGGGGLRGRDADPLADELAGVEVDEGALDA